MLDYVAENIETYPITEKDIVSLSASQNENMKAIYSNIFVEPNWLGETKIKCDGPVNEGQIKFQGNCNVFTWLSYYMGNEPEAVFFTRMSKSITYADIEVYLDTTSNDQEENESQKVQILRSRMAFNILPGSKESIEFLEAALDADNSAFDTQFSLLIDYKWEQVKKYL